MVKNELLEEKQIRGHESNGRVCWDMKTQLVIFHTYQLLILF